MTSYRSTATRTIGPLAITYIVALLVSQGFGDSVSRSEGDTRMDSGRPVVPGGREANLRLVADAVSRLQRVHTDEWDTNIPQTAKLLLTSLKHQLRDLMTNLLHDEERDASTQQLIATVIGDLRLSGVTVKERVCITGDDPYINGYDWGEIDGIDVRRPRSCSDLIAVTTTIGIPYGKDASLYLFEYEDRDWKLILADEANDYDSILGAQSSFEFGVSWPDERGSFFVVTASVNPWHTSNWQGITYRVLRPGTSAYQPRVLFSRKQSIWLGDEPPYRLEVGDAEFSLSFHDEKYLELLNNGDENGEEVSIEDPKGKRIVRYRVDGDTVIPIN